MKILIDANIALDVLLERQPFCSAGTRVLGLSKGGIELFLSASTITDIYYIIRRERKSKEIATALVKNILAIIDIAAVTGNTIRRAIALEWNDFEDAVQYATGENIAVDYIVTRNTSDFVNSSIPALEPDALLKIIAEK